MGKYTNNYQFILDEFGDTIEVNGEETRGYLQPLGVSSAGYYVDYILNTVYPIRAGNIVEYNKGTYIAIKQATVYPDYQSTILRKADWQTNFYVADDNEVYTYPCYFRNSSAIISTGTSIDVIDGNVICTVPSTSNTNKIKVNDRFIKFDQAWKIVGFDKTEDGLIYIFANKDLAQEGDDFDLELPAGAPRPKVYTIKIIPDITTPLTVGQNYEYDVAVFIDGVEDETASKKDIVCSTNNPDTTFIYNEESGKFILSCTSEASGVVISVNYPPYSVATQSVAVDFQNTYEIIFHDFPSILNVGDRVSFSLSYLINGVEDASVLQSQYTISATPESSVVFEVIDEVWYVEAVSAATVAVVASLSGCTAIAALNITEGTTTYKLEFDLDKTDDYMIVNDKQTVYLNLYANDTLVENVNQADYTITAADKRVIEPSFDGSVWKLTALKIDSTDITAIYKTDKASVTHTFEVGLW